MKFDKLNASGLLKYGPKLGQLQKKFLLTIYGKVGIHWRFNIPKTFSSEDCSGEENESTLLKVQLPNEQQYILQFI